VFYFFVVNFVVLILGVVFPVFLLIHYLLNLVVDFFHEEEIFVLVDFFDYQVQLEVLLRQPQLVEQQAEEPEQLDVKPVQ
jgi:hypothetical protein